MADENKVVVEKSDEVREVPASSNSWVWAVVAVIVIIVLLLIFIGPNLYNNDMETAPDNTGVPTVPTSTPDPAPAPTLTPTTPESPTPTPTTNP